MSGHKHIEIIDVKLERDMQDQAITISTTTSISI